jgi:hypothetical protein
VWVSGTGGTVWLLGGIEAGLANFAITVISQVGDSNEFDLTWESVEDGLYDIISSPELDSGTTWSLAVEGITGLPSTTTQRLTGNDATLFWRVRRTE